MSEFIIKFMVGELEPIQYFCNAKYEEACLRDFNTTAALSDDESVSLKFGVLSAELFSDSNTKNIDEWLRMYKVLINDLIKLYKLNGCDNPKECWKFIAQILHPGRFRKSTPERKKQEVEEEIDKLVRMRKRVSKLPESELMQLALEACRHSNFDLNKFLKSAAHFEHSCYELEENLENRKSQLMKWDQALAIRQLRDDLKAACPIAGDLEISPVKQGAFVEGILPDVKVAFTYNRLIANIFWISGHAVNDDTVRKYI